MNSFAANKCSKEKFPNCKENRHTSLQIKTKLECLVINVFPRIRLSSSDFTAVTREGAGSLLPYHPHHRTPVAKQQGRGWDRMPHTGRFWCFHTFTSAYEGKNLNLAVTEYFRITYSKSTFCDSPRKQAKWLLTWSPWAPSTWQLSSAVTALHGELLRLLG